MNNKISNYSLKNFKEGQIYTYERTISENEINIFADLSGDKNPLHINDNYALERGFNGRVVHGALLLAYLSKIIGVDCPGLNTLIHAISIKFMSPTYIKDTVSISLIVKQISEAVNVVIFDVEFKNKTTGKILAKGNVNVGFINEKGET
jgi:3-hydroxybutyryl-CoA dehydratase